MNTLIQTQLQRNIGIKLMIYPPLSQERTKLAPLFTESLTASSIHPEWLYYSLESICINNLKEKK